MDIGYFYRRRREWCKCKMCDANWISARHKDADLQVVAWRQEDECIDEGIAIRMVWTRWRKGQHDPENRQVAWVNEKVDELANTGANKDGAEVAGPNCQRCP